MTDEECVSIARQECEVRGWPWVEPYKIFKGWFRWTVVTNAEAIGANVRIVVNAKSKEVVRCSRSSR